HIEPFGTFIPPVAEQLGVVRGKNQRRTVHDRVESLELLQARAEEMAGVLVRGAQRGLAVINLLQVGTGDAMILDASETADLRRRQVWPHVIEVEVKADVAVEIAIARVARVAFVPAPDLFGGIEVASERGDAVWGEDRGEHAVTRTGPGVEHAVRVCDK